MYANKNKEFIKDYNAKFKSRNLDKNNKPYYTYTTKQGETLDIYLDSLASHSFDVIRRTDSEGNIQDLWGKYQNL